MLVITGRKDQKIRRVEHIPKSDFNPKTGVMISVPVTSVGNGYFEMYVYPHADDSNQNRMHGVVKAARIFEVKPPKKGSKAA